jgi:hypothetical protein
MSLGRPGTIPGRLGFSLASTDGLVPHPTPTGLPNRDQEADNDLDP